MRGDMADFDHRLANAIDNGWAASCRMKLLVRYAGVSRLTNFRTVVGYTRNDIRGWSCAS